MAYLPTQKWQVPVTPAATLNEVAGFSQSTLAVAAELAPVRIIYGGGWIAPQIANVAYVEDYLLTQLVWGEGPIDYVHVYKDMLATALPSGSSYTNYLGAAVQSLDPDLSTLFGGSFADTYPNIAYTIVKTPRQYGIFQLNALVNGRTLYDPRTGTTAYSMNPALALADFAGNTRYGLGLTIDWASVITVANACDEWVGPYERRRMINLVIDEPASADTWLDTLSTYAGCWAIIEGGTLTLVPDRPKASSRSFLHASGEILSLKNLKKRGYADTPTVVDIRYQTYFTFQNGSAKAFSPGVLEGTTPYRESQVSLPGLHTASQAKREAIERLNKLTLADLSCTIEVFDEALALQPGDVVTVTHPIGLTAKPFRIQRIESNLGRHTLDLLEYDPAVYSDHTESEPTYPDTAMASPLSLPNAVTSIAATEEVYQSSDGTVGSRFRISWAHSDLWPCRFDIVIYRMNDSLGTGIIQVASGKSDTTDFVHGPLEDQYWYRISITATRIHWELTGAAATFDKQSQGKAIPPSDVINLTSAITATGLVLAWLPVVDIDMAGYRVKEGATLLSTVTATSVNLGWPALGSHTYSVKAYDRSGGESASAASTSITLSAPGAVSPASTVIAGKVSLSWSAASASLPIKNYEIRHGASWAAGVLVATADATDYRVPVTWLGARTFWIAAIDAGGNVGTAGSTSITISVPSAPIVSSAWVAESLKLTWTEPAASLPISEYEIRHGASYAAGTSLGRVLGTTFALKGQWLGDRTFWIAAYDINGNEGTAGTVTATITAPTASTVTAQVIDNNVLLYWAGAVGTLPIDTYEIRRGSTWAGGTVVGTKAGGFTTIFETVAGTFTYWVAAIDTAGNYGTPASTTTTVNQPPDYVLNKVWNSALGGTMSNIATDIDGSRVMGANTTETWTTHFTGNGWASPQDQVTAGKTMFIEPAMVPAYYEETFDYGTTLAATKVTVTQAGANVSGTPALSCTISVSANGSTWTDYAGMWSVYATSFRYVKVRITLTAGQYDLSQITVTLDSKLKNDAGMAACLSTDAGGTVVPFNITFVDISSIAVTAAGTTMVSAIYDFVDAPNPTSFKILLFNQAGTRVSGTASWTARGY